VESNVSSEEAAHDQPVALVCNHQTAGDWLPLVDDVSLGGKSTVAKGAFPKSTLQQILSETALSQRFSVLAGLGTSVGIGGPTMQQLWDAVAEKDSELLAKTIELVGYVKAPEGDNIESLLTRAHLSSQLSPNEDIVSFITKAESIIVDRCTAFLKGIDGLPDHESFLRKAARRSADRARCGGQSFQPFLQSRADA